MNFKTYQTFDSEADLRRITGILETNGVEFSVEDLSSGIDTFIMADVNAINKYSLNLHPKDFEIANKLLSENAEEAVLILDETYYLYDFSDEELVDVLRNFDEWSASDFILAREILESRGIPHTDEDIEVLRQIKIEALRKPEAADSFWIVVGFVCAFLGGVLGAIMGWYYWSWKKTIVTGERVYEYDADTRAKGFNMMRIGLLFFFFWYVVGYFFLDK